MLGARRACDSRHPHRVLREDLSALYSLHHTFFYSVDDG